MKVLVTGANGFLGRHVVAALLARGHTVRALIRPAARIDHLDWPAAVEIYRADLRAPRDLSPAFADGIDVLVHLAAAVTGGEEAQFVATVVGTERLLDAMARSATRRLVLASSFSVYDWSEITGQLSEDSPLEAEPYNRDGYAVAKIWQERVTRRLATQHGWDLTVLRPGFIWGPGNAYLACLGQQIGPLHLVFSPLAQLPLTYVENCASAFACATEHPQAPNQTFNVLDGPTLRTWGYLGRYLQGTHQRGWRLPIPYRLAYAFTLLAQKISQYIFRNQGGGKLPSILVPCRFEARFKPLTYDDTKLRLLLGWQPPISLTEAMRRSFVPQTPRQAPVPKSDTTHSHPSQLPNAPAQLKEEAVSA